jgi:hypothetical protein
MVSAGFLSFLISKMGTTRCLLNTVVALSSSDPSRGGGESRLHFSLFFHRGKRQLSAGETINTCLTTLKFSNFSAADCPLPRSVSYYTANNHANVHCRSTSLYNFCVNRRRLVSLEENCLGKWGCFDRANRTAVITVGSGSSC